MALLIDMETGVDGIKSAWVREVDCGKQAPRLVRCLIHSRVQILLL